MRKWRDVVNIVSFYFKPRYFILELDKIGEREQKWESKGKQGNEINGSGGMKKLGK